MISTLFAFCSFLLVVTSSQFSSLSSIEKAKIKDVTFVGKINNTGGNDDFRQLRDLCCGLKNIDLSNADCDSIRANSLHSRHQLKNIFLPKNLRVIGSQAFYACDGLKEIVIPASVERIEALAFANCKGLRKIHFESAIKPDIAPDAFLGVKAKVNIKFHEEDKKVGCLSLLPLPLERKIYSSKGLFLSLCSSKMQINAPAFLQNEVHTLRAVLQYRLPDNNIKRTSTAHIDLSVCDTMRYAESYKLEIKDQYIKISGSDAAGVFYGIMTLDQLLLSAQNMQQTVIEAQEIYDKPRTKIRELMVDPCRHFIPYKDLELLIREMSRYKFNALHLHLVDDQAWRIEIKKYPLLTKKGSSRVGMDDMQQKISGYYTQKQLKKLVQFAKKYHVEIIPEIEMPGHEVAAIHCYPELTCGCKQVPIRTTCGVSNELLCPSSNFTYTFLNDVFIELASVFDSKYIHLGGDEAGNPALDCWTSCFSCQKLKRDLGVMSQDRNENWRLQQYLFDRVISYLQDSLHKVPMFWYETDFKKIQPGCIVFAWRHGLTQTAIEAARKNNAYIILCPGEHCYFDYPAKRGDMPEVNWGMPITTLKKTYSIDPTWGNDANFENNNLYGVAGTLWSECVNSSERLFYMAFPRGLALAEAAWTPQSKRSYDDFLLRLRPILNDMHVRGVCTGNE